MVKKTDYGIVITIFRTAGLHFTALDVERLVW